jgi:hypothetical protein
MKLANALRILFGVIYLVGAMANSLMGLFSPNIYDSFADLAFLPLYRDLWESLILPYLCLWLVLVVVFEAGTGLLILSKGRRVKIGLAAGIVFCLFLVPFWWAGGALLNVVFALIQVWLLRYEYGADLIELFWSRWVGGEQ